MMMAVFCVAVPCSLVEVWNHQNPHRFADNVFTGDGISISLPERENPSIQRWIFQAHKRIVSSFCGTLCICWRLNFKWLTLKCSQHRHSYCALWISCHIEITFPLGNGPRLTSRQKVWLLRNYRIKVFTAKQILDSDAIKCIKAVCFKEIKIEVREWKWKLLIHQVTFHWNNSKQRMCPRILYFLPSEESFPRST